MPEVLILKKAFTARTLTFFIGLILLVLLPWMVRRSFGLDCLGGRVSDFWSALLFLWPVLFCSRKVRFPFVVLWVVVQAGSFELLSSMSRLPTWRDLIYLFDAQFIGSTFFSTTAFGVYDQVLFVLGGGVLAFLPPIKIIQRKRKLWLASALVVLLVLLFVGHAKIVSVPTDKTLYAQYNPAHWLLSQVFDGHEEKTQGDRQGSLRQQLDGRRYISSGQARNVLVIVLEGLTGSYLDRSRKYFDLPETKTTMPLLSQFAERGMILPDFVAHGHQTIRGLYALLCADYDKLSWSTPKSTLLQNRPEKALDCLPHQLKKKGFETHYLQGADLVFMGKDRFMPLIGFDHVSGREWFSLDPARTYHWGPDDKTFFQGVLSYIEELQKTKKPWFLTTLTVGTHYPYEVTDDFAAHYENRKQASVAYLDQAVGDFLKELERRGVFKNTLVVVTSDESHGSELGDWSNAWIPAVIFAPEQYQLPKINKNCYGLIDTTLSILDYFGKIVPEIPGRSFFRRYRQPREIVSFTADRLRWLDGEGRRIECTGQGKCRLCDAHSLIGPVACQTDEEIPSTFWMQKARSLDQNLDRPTLGDEIFRFASGKKQVVKKPWQDQWIDNLIGAQYLDFEARTETTVTMTWKVLQAPPEGAKMILAFKESDQPTQEQPPELPTLQTGEEKSISFVIKNFQERKNFSFHLLAEAPCEIQMSDFTVVTKKMPFQALP